MAENKVAEELRYIQRYYTMRTPPPCEVMCIPTLVKEAADEIERLEAENEYLRGRRWIPVTEQMPEEDALVEILDINDHPERARYRPRKDYPDNPWESRPSVASVSLLRRDRVTHWRPIVYRPVNPAITEKLEPAFDISDFDPTARMRKGLNKMLHEIGEEKQADINCYDSEQKYLIEMDICLNRTTGQFTITDRKTGEVFTNDKGV